MIAGLNEDPAVVSRLSLEALELAARYCTPPAPAVYEIWYGYASGENRALNVDIDEIVASNGRLTPIDIIRIHDKFFSMLPIRRGLARIGAEFEDKLDGLVEAVADGAHAGRSFGVGLQAVTAKISKADDPETVRQLVERIVALNERHLSSVAALSDSLQSAQKNLAKLGDDLRSLQQHAFLDHLTQLSNRRHFDETLAKEVDAARAKSEPLCLVIADIDHFKSVNDRYGHAMGDRMLVKFAEILRSNIKGRDAAARIGGEEFALILPHTSLKGAVALAERIRKYVSVMRVVDRASGKRLTRLTASFGVAELGERDDAYSLLVRADALLYAAKNAGRDTVKSDADCPDAASPDAQLDVARVR